MNNKSKNQEVIVIKFINSLIKQTMGQKNVAEQKYSVRIE